MTLSINISNNNPLVNGRHYIVNPKTGCWDWIRYKQKDGYGVIVVNGKKRLAHLVPFGKVNKNMTHKCGIRHCVNPAHLTIVIKG